MSLPRNLSVKKVNNEWVLIQKPVTATNSLRKENFKLAKEIVSEHKTLPIKSTQFEIELTITPSAASVSGVKIAVGNNNYFEIGYDAAQQIFYIDRSKSGNTTFNDNFSKASRFEKLIPLQNKQLQLHIYFDNSIAEIFVNDGAAVFTAQLFPEHNNNGIELFNRGEKSTFSKISLWKMKSAW
jgi:sucrose-6-phosphate hydrolase SacC (GH32 family)